MLSKQWILVKKPIGEVRIAEHFKLQSKSLAPLSEGQALCKTLYLSNDPAPRLWMDGNIDTKRLYHPAMVVGEPVTSAGVIARIEQVKGGDLRVGDLVLIRSSSWSEYFVASQAYMTTVSSSTAPPSSYLGLLGGLAAQTAYWGVTDVLKLKSGESCVISGAAGGVGSFCVQWAKKVIGASKVVAIAGTEAKCSWLKSIGADEALNYKAADFEEQLRASTPSGGFSTAFDNVGGDILSALLPNMARHGRIAVCGSISSYNDSERIKEVANWFEVINLRLQIKGFLISDYWSRLDVSQAIIVEAFRKGHLDLKGSETVVQVPFEKVPEVWLQLFSSSSQGKLLTEIKED